MVNKPLDWYLNWNWNQSSENQQQRSMTTHWLSDDLLPSYHAYDFINWSYPQEISLRKDITILDNNLSPATYYGKEFQPILQTIRRLEKRQEYYKTFIKGKTT